MSDSMFSAFSSVDELHNPKVWGNKQLPSSVEKLHRSFGGWHMDIIKKYMVQEGIYTADEIDQAEVEYKRWLAIAVGHIGQPVPISAKVDKFWHSHILFTEDYTEMCERIAGRYIHHRPSILDNKSRLDMAFEAKTLQLYTQYFGTPDPRFWDSALCKCCERGISPTN